MYELLKLTGLLGIAMSSNWLFGIYKSVNIANLKFSKERAINGLLKILIVLYGCFGTTYILEELKKMGYEIPGDIIIPASLVVAAIILYAGKNVKHLAVIFGVTSLKEEDIQKMATKIEKAEIKKTVAPEAQKKTFVTKSDEKVTEKIKKNKIIEQKEPKQEKKTIKHTVKSGESLSRIAYLYYGDYDAWKPIAKTNNIKKPYVIHKGNVLVIPDVKEKPDLKINEDLIVEPISASHYVTSSFGWRNDPKSGVKSFHRGTDYGTHRKKVNAVAIANGTVAAVMSASDGNGAGNRVYIKHTINGKNYYIGYFHLDSYCVKKGQKVEQGEKIGIVGTTGYSTGIHLHFQMMEGNVYSNEKAIDFEKWKKQLQ